MTRKLDIEQARALLAELVRDADAEQLPDLIGALEAAKVRAIVRLQQPLSKGEAEPHGLVDAAKMAKLLDVPTNWVLDKARAGTLPCRRLGHYVRFEPAEVLEAARRVPGLHDSRLSTLRARTGNRNVTRASVRGCPTLPGADADDGRGVPVQRGDS